MKYKMKAIVGMPGCGKSTVGDLLGKLPEFVTMDFGKIVRSLSISSYLGKKLNNFIKNGDSFPPAENLEILDYFLSKCEKEKTFDPSTQTIICCGNFGKVENVDIFKSFFYINQVFVLEIDENMARKRLINQMIQQKRTDGSLDIADKRILNYNHSISEILEQFDNEIIYYINADDNVEKVYENIKLLATQ